MHTRMHAYTPKQKDVELGVRLVSGHEGACAREKARAHARVRTHTHACTRMHRENFHSIRACIYLKLYVPNDG
jgi:hypothetical protein